MLLHYINNVPSSSFRLTFSISLVKHNSLLTPKRRYTGNAIIRGCKKALISHCFNVPIAGSYTEPNWPST